MPFSNYPNGFAGGVTLRNVPALENHGGNVFWVDSGAGSNDNSGKFDRPFPTVQQGIDACTANNGDIVVMKAGHSEDPTVSIDQDTAGVWVYGMGWGNSRPTITFGAAGAEWAMSAASGRLTNVRFDLGVVAATVTNAINVTADGCMVENNETVMHATSQFTNHCTCTDAQWLVVKNNMFRGLHTASSTSGLVVDGCDDMIIEGNVIMGHFTEHALDNTTPASAVEILRATVVGNYIHNDATDSGNDKAVELDSLATGILAYNVISGSEALLSNIDYGNMRLIENYLTDAADVSGILVPTTAAA